jgi:nucleotide-binding universal stress UspA family protein
VSSSASPGEVQAPVVIAYDGSPAARQAIVATARILRSCPALVVTVWEEGLAYAQPPMPAGGMIAEPMVEPGMALDVDHALHEQADRVSREGADFARAAGIEAEPLAVADERNVAATLISVADERHAAAILIGSRGLGGIRARLEGSTSKSLLKHATCPVIVVHEADEEHG